MYFWAIRDLVYVLGQRELTEREAFRYYFANSILLAIAVELPKENWNVWDTASAVAAVAIAIAGLIYCFRSNGGAAGQAFLSRFNALLWVVTIRLLAALIPIALVVVIVTEMRGIDTEVTAWWDVLITIVVEVLIYSRVAAHLRRIVRLREHWSNVGGAPAQLAELAKV